MPALPLSARAALAWGIRDAFHRPVLVIADTARSLDTLYQDLLTLSGGRPDETAYYPAWESLPGKGAPPQADLLGDRLDTLQRCLEPGARPVIASSIQALMQKLLPPAELNRMRLDVRVGGTLERDDLLVRLEEMGYEFVPEVQSKGEAAHRGGILDVWPATEPWPVRIEFFGDVIDSLRTFDPAEQTSINRIDALNLLTMKEGASDRSALLLDYLPDETAWIWSDEESIREHAAQYEELLAGEEGIVTYASLTGRIKRRFPAGQVVIGAHGDAARLEFEPVAGVPSIDLGSYRADALEEERRRFVRHLLDRASQGTRVHCFFDTGGVRDRFIEAYTDVGPVARALVLHVGVLSEGFQAPERNLLLVAESDIYGRRKELRGRYDPHARPRGAARMMGARIAEWRDLLPGELVVHVDHGVGKYLGLYEIEFDRRLQEVLMIEYADDARLYVPVSQVHLLSRYIGIGKRRPDLHALGGRKWEREKVAAQRAVQDLASSLIETQAARETLKGHAYSPDTPWQHEFEAAFPFQETEDQARAIREVKEDMESARPTDRLICGDVGYGKTEVAMRAAFKAVMDGRQVAVLVPTTVLAQQHFQTFSERMAAFPVRIEMLSRFRTRAQQQDVVRRLGEGGVDIVIGTHRLVQPDVRFKELGLVIIDEEQRFGVEHKEGLKRLRQMVDVLTMTATPIPRTLYMSLTGARDISTIQTPPQERLPVETIVTEYSDDVVRDAIRRELGRGGQVFYLHNRVHSIQHAHRKLARLAPEARMAVAHGRMHERELESIMLAFVRGDIDVLLCTTIIESGVDIPNVNTIFIERADRFGMADLYQLRGRVGRYKHKAYAYLLLPRHGGLFSAARQRVQAIRKYSGLGSGFKLALRDLELRGAGNILGAEQSGHIHAVGFDLYCQFLHRTIARLKGEPVPPIIDVEIKLDFIDPSPSHAAADNAAAIPYDYIEDESLRVNLYRRLASLVSPKELEACLSDSRDRYGPLPPAMNRLFKIGRIRLQCAGCDIQRIETQGDKVLMTRRGEFLMKNRRFPRMQGRTPDEKLDDLVRIVADWKP